MTQEFLDSGGKFEEISLSKLFLVKSNPQLDKYCFVFSEKSKYPYFTRTVFNNGIYGYVDYFDSSHLIKGDSIAVGMMGMQFFYMSKDFYAGQFTKTLYPKFEDFDEDVALYFISILNLYQNRLKAELVRNFESYLLSQKPKLPTKDSKIAFDFMRRYIATLKAERVATLKAERVATLKAYLQASGLQDTILTEGEQAALDALLQNRVNWKQVEVCGKHGVFDVINTHSILKSQVVAGSGTCPYVGAGESNNSIQSYISYDMSQIERGNSIMIGGKTLVITYQEQDYFSNDSHNLALYFKPIQDPNRSIQLFLVSALYRSLKPKYHWGDSISKSKIKSDKLILPIGSNGEIDYKFIENLISAQIKLCIKNVMSSKDLEISTTERVINEGDEEVNSKQTEVTTQFFNEMGLNDKLPIAAEPFTHYGNIDVIIPNRRERDSSLTLMYAISPAARQKTQSAGKIALGIKERDLVPEVVKKYKEVDSILFHYWKNETATLINLKEPVRVVPAQEVPSEYLIRQGNGATHYLLLEYNVEECLPLSGFDILKIQRRGDRRYMPFVTDLKDCAI